MAKLNSNANLNSNTNLNSNASFITSKENKEVLWNVLYNNKVFNNIPESNFNNIQMLFEKTILKSLDEARELSTNTISDPKNIIAINQLYLSTKI